MNMVCPRGRDTVLLVRFSRGFVKAEMEISGYNIVRRIRGGTSSLISGDRVGTRRTPESREDSRKGLIEEVTFGLNHKVWVRVGPEN